MFVKVYDKDLTYIGVVSALKYTITKRIFDLDTGSVEGVCKADITNGVIFQLVDELKNEEVVYAGLIKNLVQENDMVSFKAEDFKKMLDSEVALTISPFAIGTQLGYYLVLLLQDVFLSVKQANIKGDNIIEFIYDISQVPDIDTTWIANYYGVFLIENALSFMKLYLAYYNLYIKSYFNLSLGKVVFEVAPQDTTAIEITLEDFDYNQTLSDVKINHTIAYIEFDTRDEEQQEYIKTTQDYYDKQLPTNKQSFSAYVDDPVAVFGDATHERIGFAFRLEVLNEVWPHATKWVSYYIIQYYIIPRPTLPIKHYYLGNDNNIYENDIPNNKLLWPIITKSFQAAFLAEAQALAIKELVDARYNENIILDNTSNLIDFESINLGKHFNINKSKILPVSEIEINDSNEIKIKLGFKKTLFTEVIKK